MSGPISAIVRALVSAQATPAMILAAVEAAEQQSIDKLTARREADAARQARYRDNHPRNVTQRDPLTAVPSRAGARAEPETTNSSENTEKEKEERKIPPPADLPKAKAIGKTLCPEVFEPSERLMDLGRREGLDLPAILRSRDEMVSWSRGNGEKRLDWDAVFANWLRRNAAKARAGPPKPKAGNGSGWGDVARYGIDERDDTRDSERYLAAPVKPH